LRYSCSHLHCQSGKGRNQTNVFPSAAYNNQRTPHRSAPDLHNINPNILQGCSDTTTRPKIIVRRFSLSDGTVSKTVLSVRRVSPVIWNFNPCRRLLVTLPVCAQGRKFDERFPYFPSNRVCWGPRFLHGNRTFRPPQVRWALSIKTIVWIHMNSIHSPANELFNYPDMAITHPLSSLV
jgi:hypothetical protein